MRGAMLDAGYMHTDEFIISRQETQLIVNIGTSRISAGMNLQVSAMPGSSLSKHHVLDRKHADAL